MAAPGLPPNEQYDDQADLKHQQSSNVYKYKRHGTDASALRRRHENRSGRGDKPASEQGFSGSGLASYRKKRYVDKKMQTKILDKENKEHQLLMMQKKIYELKKSSRSSISSRSRRSSH